MANLVDFYIKELESMKQYPKELFYKGNLELLKKTKISIVGSRKPNQYARVLTNEIASKLANNNVCIVSGGAMGIDTIAHYAAGVENTIMVAGTGLNIRYPAINKKLIQNIENEGLVLSQFKENTPSNRYNFPLRNELVVALGDILIVSFADLDSGTIRSVEYALKMNKPIYVLPHRIHESSGTNKLLRESKAQAIYDVDELIAKFAKPSCNITLENIDDFLQYCQSNPTFDEAILKYGELVYEYELNSKIDIKNGKIYCI